MIKLIKESKCRWFIKRSILGQDKYYLSSNSGRLLLIYTGKTKYYVYYLVIFHNFFVNVLNNRQLCPCPIMNCKY